MPVTIIRKLPKHFKPSSGAHSPGSKDMCIMEAAAYLVNGWTDHPECVSSAIAQFCRSWNDGMNSEDRQMLTPYAVKVLGTATTAADEQTRAFLAMDWLIRVHTPAWLRLAGLTGEAQALESLARITDATLLRTSQPSLDAARQKADAAWTAAWAAAWAAARDAAGTAAWAAAGTAAGTAAWAAAGTAAGAAARTAAGTAAWDAAGTAAGAAAGTAAGAAAGDAAWAAAGAAAWTAAWDATRPVVVALQKSALGLLDEMIAVGRQEVVTKIPRTKRVRA